MSIIGTAGAIAGGLNAAKGLFTNKNDQDRRQLRQQGKLQELQIEGSKELADYEQDLKMKMWNDTNYGAILDQANKAGVSKAAAIGGSVGGTQGASVGGTAGGQAANAAQTEANDINKQMATAQIANTIANTHKTVAETKNIGEDTTGREMANKVTAETIDAMIEGRIQAANTERGRAKELELANKFEEWLQTGSEAGQPPKQAQAWATINETVGNIQLMNDNMAKNGAQINLWAAQKGEIGANTALKQQLKEQLDKLNPMEVQNLKMEIDKAVKLLEMLKNDPANTKVGQYINFGVQSIKGVGEAIGEIKGLGGKRTTTIKEHTNKQGYETTTTNSR